MGRTLGEKWEGGFEGKWEVIRKKVRKVVEGEWQGVEVKWEGCREEVGRGKIEEKVRRGGKDGWRKSGKGVEEK